MEKLRRLKRGKGRKPFSLVVDVNVYIAEGEFSDYPVYCSHIVNLFNLGLYDII